MRILVIEDEERVASLIKKGLEELGFSVTVASDGLTGKKLALSDAFDLVITDIILPGINGLELCKYIRLELPDTPIIMLTALGTTDDKWRALIPERTTIWLSLSTSESCTSGSGNC